MYETIIRDFRSDNKNISNLSKTGSLFVIAKNEYDDNGNIIKNIFDYIYEYEKLGLRYINMIIVPSNNDYFSNSTVFLNDNIYFILWFVKDIKDYLVYKDTIREKHIWKNVEWGKRKKNYNSKGKDPGNVWIPTEDDGKGSITKHIVLKIDEVLTRIINFSSKENEKVLINIAINIDVSKLPKREYEIDVISYIQKKNSNNISKESTIESTLLTEGNIPEAKIIYASSENLEQIEDNSLDLMITSPPYWDIKNYFKEGQIGKESYNEYLTRLKKVWKETYNKMSSNGSVWININTIFKNKKVILIPREIINQCINIGFKLKKIIIWHKSSAIPTHAKNLSDHHEYFLCFSKGEDIKINLDSIIDIADYKNEVLNYGIIWNINRKAGTVGKNYIHPAIYPLRLIERIVQVYSYKYDNIFDPFLGSGTTLLAAINNNRNFIGYEYNEDFNSLIMHRIENEAIVDFNLSKELNDKNKETMKIFRNE